MQPYHTSPEQPIQAHRRQLQKIFLCAGNIHTTIGDGSRIAARWKPRAIHVPFSRREYQPSTMIQSD
jgi:hypothetical protein